MDIIKINAQTFTEQNFRDDDDPHRIVATVSDLSKVSDGYHTIAELYDHRITLWIALCKMKSEFWKQVVEDHVIEFCPDVWRSKIHSDGKSFDGWFMLGIGKEKGKQMTYHLPNSRWDDTSFAETLDRAPEFDGHTSADVLTRLKNL